MSSTPDELRYTAEHEWVSAATDDGTVRIGITDHAQSALGDIVYVSLPAQGAELTAGQPCGEVESTKSVSEIYAPLDGVVVERNALLDASPDLVNSDPYGEGWMIQLRLTAPSDVEGLMSGADYAKLAESLDT